MALELSKNCNDEMNEQQSKISNELPQNISGIYSNLNLYLNILIIFLYI